ncbi:tyrosine-type recombinase/integrase, partial [Bacillus pumilus]|uniref:tyrosine-type recombinase/integrase n=1 Tax=Bacillus pumilus TaxID=1408 RepID=UPI0011A4247F
LGKEDKGIGWFLYEEEVKEVFRVCDVRRGVGERKEGILEVVYGRGMRVSELCCLKECDVDLWMDRVVVDGKGRKEGYVGFG